MNKELLYCVVLVSFFSCSIFLHAGCNLPALALVADPVPAGSFLTGAGSTSDTRVNIMGFNYKYWIEDNPRWLVTGQFTIGPGVTSGIYGVTYTVAHSVSPTLGWANNNVNYSYVRTDARNFQVQQNGHADCQTTVMVWQEVNDALLKRIKVKEVHRNVWINVGNTTTHGNASIGIQNFSAQKKIGS